MARAQLPKHDPESLGVPDVNIVDLRPRQDAPVEKPKAKNTARLQPVRAPRQARHFSWPRLRFRSDAAAALERWWWQVDTRNVAVFGILVVAVVGLLGGAQAFGALRTTQGAVLGASTDAYSHLRLAQQAIDQDALEAAAAEFRAAQVKFQAAAEEIDRVPGWLVGVLKLIPGPGTTIRSGEHLLRAGTAVAQAGESIIAVMQQFKQEQALTVPTTPQPGTTVALLPILDALEGDLASALAAAQRATEELSHVSVASVPANYRRQIALVKSALPAAERELGSINSVVTLLKAVLGTQSTKEYLLAFQNNNEVRATGGFIGSLAQIAIHDGTLRVVEVPGRGAYEINDDFDLKIVPPRPLWLINNAWQIQDANWWPDWPTSAAKLIWFYETARGFPINGIISLTPDVMIDLLRVTGEVNLQEKYGVTVTADNFLSTVQDISFDQQENRPKAIIADLMPVVISRLLNTNAGQLLDTLTAVNQSLATKQLLLYFADPDLEKLVRDLGWGGEVRQTPADYLSVVHTNIGGGKTDLVMATEIEHKAEIQPDGSIIDTVTIIRRHNGATDDPQQRVKNMDYVRIYVPSGSTLIEAGSFSQIDSGLLQFPTAGAIADDDLERLEGNVVTHETSGTRIYGQFDKTVFANWIGVEVGGTTIATLKYRLPLTIGDSPTYQLLLQKQSGTRGDAFTSTLSWAPRAYGIEQVVPNEGIQKAADSLTFSTTLTTDRAWGARLKPIK